MNMLLTDESGVIKMSGSASSLTDILMQGEPDDLRWLVDPAGLIDNSRLKVDVEARALALIHDGEDEPDHVTALVGARVALLS